MKILVKLYERALVWAKHKHASHYLAAVSFVESSVFPIPPDVMLAPMTLASPNKAVRYASIATLSSVCGGILGYLLGLLAFKPVVIPMLSMFGYEAAYEIALQRFQDWGFWGILLAGFTPIPYKLFTIGAGFLQFAFWPFIVASIIGRGARFFLVALCLQWGGDTMERWLRRCINQMGWVFVGLAGIIVGIKLMGII